MSVNRNILLEDFNDEPIILSGYDDFFSGVMNIVKSGSMNEELGERIKQHTFDFVTGKNLNGPYGQNTYSRNYIGRDEQTGWEAIVMAWVKGNKTAIHSHPQYAGYTFADGEFLIEIFEATENDEIIKVNEVQVSGVDGFYSIGADSGFENHIHRITCLSDTGHSLHVYSDDALKGYKYKDNL